MDDEPFAEERWEADLAHIIGEHEIDQLSGIDAGMLAEYLATVTGALVRLVKKRDADMPEALSAEERAELAAARKAIKLQETIIAQEQQKVSDLEIRLADLQRLRFYEHD